MKRKLRIGSRESLLAVRQTELVMDRIRAIRPDWELELVTMKTTGDRILNKTLDQVGGKGLFVRELHEALREGRVDLAVHSLKDMPMEEEEELPIGAFIRRGDPRDCLVYRREWDKHNGHDRDVFIVGTSSARRRIQMARLHEENGIKGAETALEIRSVRGNIVTRLEKLDRGEYDALILAAAGLERAGVTGRELRYFEPDEMLPAAGQGILAVQCRKGFEPQLMEELNDLDTMAQALAERSFVRTLGGGCSSPVAAFACIKDGMLHLEGLNCHEGSGHFWRQSVWGRPEEAEDIGIRLAERMKRKGKVWLVGAGPSDPGLMTLKGQHVLKQAEVVVYDHLIGDPVRQMIPKTSQSIDAGKQAGNHKMTQEAINRLLLEKALEGYRVVRLKGGDPFLFGRGAEELELLETWQIPYEVVPGVTSALAVPAYGGIPVTHRQYASSVHIVAGQRREGTEGIDFAGLAALKRTTLIFLMGVSQLEHICAGLMEAGMDGSTKAAILEKGTASGQRQVAGTLETLPQLAVKESIGTPGIIVVGEVCGLADRFSWAEKRPLQGARVWVTRPSQKGSRLSVMLYDMGAEVLEVPAIETRPLTSLPYLEKERESLLAHQWMAFASETAVTVFFDYLQEKRMDLRQLAGIKMAAVGKATARALEARGVIPDFVPAVFDAIAMAEGLEKQVREGERVAVFVPLHGESRLVSELRKRGVALTEIPLYETVSIPLTDMAARSRDLFAFASASAVRGFMSAKTREEVLGKTAVCIGDKTAAEARRHGFSVSVAQEASLESMAQTLVSVWERMKRADAGTEPQVDRKEEQK